MDCGDVSTLRAALDRRYAVLDAADSEAADKRELTARLSVSRSTVNRGVRELERLGLLERADDGYRLTAVGTTALQEYERTTERLEAITTASTLLGHLPPDIDIDAEALVGADIVTPTQETPFRPVEHTNDLIRRADSLRTCTTTVVPPQIEVYHEAVTGDGTELSSVTTAEAFDLLVSEHRAKIVNALDTGSYEVYLTDCSVPYGLLVGDCPEKQEMCLTVYDDDGIAGVIANDMPEAVAWANERLDRYFETAEPVAMD